MDLKRECEAKIAVDAALVDFVKQHSGNTYKLRITNDPVAEYPLSHHQYTGFGTVLAIQPRRIANPSADRFA